mmetsp:Transcript_16714/g.41019  ORF Transcript_16714/g.41019 Transcript_16714/m.41019 type:complete len:334 (+) Transcript_16714:293-1294(+)
MGSWRTRRSSGLNMRWPPRTKTKTTPTTAVTTAAAAGKAGWGCFARRRSVCYAGAPTSWWQWVASVRLRPARSPGSYRRDLNRCWSRASASAPSAAAAVDLLFATPPNGPTTHPSSKPQPPPLLLLPTPKPPKPPKPPTPPKMTTQTTTPRASWASWPPPLPPPPPPRRRLTAPGCSRAYSRVSGWPAQRWAGARCTSVACGRCQGRLRRPRFRSRHTRSSPRHFGSSRGHPCTSGWAKRGVGAPPLRTTMTLGRWMQASCTLSSGSQCPGRGQKGRALLTSEICCSRPKRRWRGARASCTRARAGRRSAGTRSRQTSPPPKPPPPPPLFWRR